MLAASVLAFAAGCGGADGTNNGGDGGTVGTGGQDGGGGGVTGSAGSGGTIGAGGSTGTGGTGSGVNYPPACTYQGIELTRQSVSEQPGYLSYRAINVTQAPFDVVYLQFYQGAPYNGPTAPGTYDLAGTNYQDCGLCLLAKRGCGTDGNCDQTFYADIGEVRIDAIGEDDFKLKATLINVIFREVTINPTNWLSVPIDGGDFWCAYETDLEVARIPTQPVCVEEGTGIELDENIGDFSLQQCSTGKFINVHSFCGQEKALWMMAVTGWCPACAQAVPMASQAEQTTPGLDVLILYAEDENYQTPTLQNCRNYATSHNISADKLFLDPGWQTFFNAINPHLSNEILLPWNAVFDGDNMEYEYCDSCNTGDLNDALNAALND